MDEFHAGFNQFFAQHTTVILAGGCRLAILSGGLILILWIFVGKLLHVELEDLLNEAGKRVVDLQEGVEVAGVSNVAKACRLILVSRSLIDARNWLIVAIVSRLLVHGLSDGRL